MISSLISCFALHTAVRVALFFCSAQIVFIPVQVAAFTNNANQNRNLHCHLQLHHSHLNIDRHRPNTSTSIPHLPYAPILRNERTFITSLSLSSSSSSSSSSSNKSQSQHLSLDQFDFASLRGWDDFYQQKQNKKETNVDMDVGVDGGAGASASAGMDMDVHVCLEQKQSKYGGAGDGVVEPVAGTCTGLDTDIDTEGTFEFEWHSSIPHDTIISEIDSMCTGTKVLFVGTGNSNLPRQLYDEREGNLEVTCMDYSQPCIDMLKKLHNKVDYPGMHFVCGDVTDLIQTLDRKGILPIFDYIVDKGLMDAMVCGEGWDSSNDSSGVKKYLVEAKRALRPSGNLILVSYKLSTGMKEYLENVGADLGIQWTLDIAEKSNERVSFSIGRPV